MKILLCSHEMSYTGAPRSLLSILDVLSELGHEISVWSLKDGPFTAQFTNIGYKVQIIEFPQCKSSDFANEIKYFDLIIANTVFCAAFGIYAQQYSQTILWLREARNLQQIIHDCDIKKSDIENARHIVCVSEYAKKSIQRLFNIKNIYVIHNFVNDLGCPKLNLVKNGKINFIVSGTIEERKQQHAAIEAYKMMPEELRNICQLHIVGTCPSWSKHYWESLITNIPQGVFWHNEITNDDKLFDLYKQMNVFIVPSLDESCSRVALEGAMLGKALILSENIGGKYLLNSDKYVFKEKDISDLSWKMRKLTSRKNLLICGLFFRKQYIKFGTRVIFLNSLKAYLNQFQ